MLRPRAASLVAFTFTAMTACTSASPAPRSDAGLVLADATTPRPDAFVLESDAAAPIDSASTMTAPTWRQDVWPLLSSCRVCHARDTNPPRVDVPDATYARLVDVRSRQVQLDLVEPGDAEQSYLYLKFAGTHRGAGGMGERMPKDGQPFTDAQLATVRAWIDRGAPLD